MSKWIESSSFSMFKGGLKPNLYTERKKAEHKLTLYRQVVQLPSLGLTSSLFSYPSHCYKKDSFFFLLNHLNEVCDFRL